MRYGYEIDFDRMMQQVQDLAVIEAIGNCIQDPHERKMITTFVEVLVRHGIKAFDALNIAREYADLVKEDI